MAIPRAIARPTPGPPGTLGATLPLFSSMGGPSTDNDTTVSPRNKTSPSVRFSSLSSFSLPFTVTFRNSSASPRTRFMCLSNAMNFPTITRLSCIVTFTLQLMNRSILLDFDAAIFVVVVGRSYVLPSFPCFSLGKTLSPSIP